MSEMNAPKGNGWSEWQNHVLAELKRLSGNVEKLNQTVEEHRIACAAEFSALKVKASLWGGLAGAIPVVIMVGLYLLFGR